jgi:hypothetical protein
MAGCRASYYSRPVLILSAASGSRTGTVASSALTRSAANACTPTASTSGRAPVTPFARARSLAFG